jgi:hypothetical protein
VAKSERRAKARTVVPAGRQTKTESLTSTQGEKPLFCFAHADVNANPLWAFKPDGEHASELFVFLCEMAKLTWREIEAMRAKGHKRHHDQDVESICVEAKQDFKRVRLGEIFGADIFRFRVDGEKRLWGFRKGATFHVIWWDPGHQVYPTEPN